MRGFSTRRLSKFVLKFGCTETKTVLYIFSRYLSDERFKKPRLWSDDGNLALNNNDKIGGWQTDDAWLLNRVDINNIKHKSLKGLKKYNEDRVQVTELSRDIMFLGIFDGHGGSFVVNFVQNNLHQYVRNMLERGSSLTTALRKGFLDCDMALAKTLEKEENKDKFLRSGSTATVAILKNGEELVIGNVGDSQAILCHDGKAVLLTEDHNALSKAEKNRILARGGKIEEDGEMTPRVNGRLAMTRCFGNFDLKPYGVNAVPKIYSVKINQDKDSFLALFTDGISNVMATEQAVNILNSSTIPDDSLELLTSSAAQFGSVDDITVIMAPFRSFGTKDEENELDVYKMKISNSFNISKCK